MFLKQLAFEGHPVFEVSRDDLEEPRHKLNAKEELSLAIKTPREQVNQGHQSIGLQHVVTVLTQTTKLCQNFNHQVDHFGQAAEFSTWAGRDTLTDHVNHCRYELEFSHEVEVTGSAFLENLGHIVEDGFNRVEFDVREDRLL